MNGHEALLPDEALSLFDLWLSDARVHPLIAEPTAMCLATCGTDGVPSARIVLLKAHDARGFVFYTNLESRKGGEIRHNANVALCFHWMPLERQVRIEGMAMPVTDAEADTYFASRPRESRLGAWASEQSRPLSSRETLVARINDAERYFAGAEVPRPPHWSGFRVMPRAIEFWEQGSFRLHERQLWRPENGAWNNSRLYP